MRLKSLYFILPWIALLSGQYCFIASAHAMWVGMSDAELVKSSELIVTGSFIGNTSVYITADNKNLNLGVLKVENTFKGQKSDIVLIRLPYQHRPGSPQKSDDLFYKAGQSGLWFLKADSHNKGIYLADHPQRFVPAMQLESKLQAIDKLLNQE